MTSPCSKKFFEAHREELTLHKAAKDAFDELGVKMIPKVKDLNSEYAELMASKKQAYAEYRKARDEAQEYEREVDDEHDERHVLVQKQQCILP